MNKSLLAVVVSGALLLSGCSSSSDSSGSGQTNPQTPVIPDIDNSPEWGLDVGDTPDWGLADPDFGLPTPSVPDIDNTPDWGIDTGTSTPDRLPPVWGGPEMPPIDNGPEASYTISGNTITDANGNVFTITSVNWHGQSMMIQDKDGNEHYVSIIRQGKYEGDFGIVIDGESIIIGRDTVQGGLRPLMENTDRNIDRNSIRDSIRSRLN
ncbi:hypothetical protein A6D98_07960 [Aliivibrio fischeri]|uniref:hypothetical protein n=1 Tax=Aliivibrio fischeri TaxID=668 RepID=UPI00080E641E|nr:hypothetical protein [Aliivibrio fischeri]MUH95421.1 hypothetical protein [Aliivibrio fischeri]MUI64199.1 hypothetical protein [Aliivibrio fischeri]OCH03326.1 hypothetical protein A6E10_15220 [Aliivibrio fischeri]OCH12630.1 hypothetical protein A6E09_08570 [Aliivibrio fischeri]OCH24847.1 hypothetical protein A6E12_15785 [Aliivibrio fischeri]